MDRNDNDYDELIIYEDGGLEELALDPHVIRLDARKEKPEALPLLVARIAKYAKMLDVQPDDVAPEKQFVLKIPRDMQKGLDDGTLQLLQKKDGTNLAVVVKKVGNKKQFAGIIGVEEAEVPKSDAAKPDTTEADLYSQAIQQQLAALIEEVREMRAVVDLIEIGQDTDRFAKVTAGENLLRLAVGATDPENRRHFTMEAVAKLTEGSEQIAAALRTRLLGMRTVPRGTVRRYLEAAAENDYVAKRDADFDKAQDHFAFLEKAWNLMAFSVVALEEPQLLPVVSDIARREMESLPLAPMRSMRRLHPALRKQIEGEWFMRPEGYIEDYEDGYKRLAETSQDYIEIEATGEMLLEAMSDAEDE